MFSNRPILIGGLGLSATLLLLDTIHFNFFDSSTLLSAIALSSGIWWWRHLRQDKPSQQHAVAVKLPDRAAVDRAIATLESLITSLEQESASTLSTVQAALLPLSKFREQVQALQTGLERQMLSVGLLGERNAGKTDLLNHLQNNLGVSANSVQLTYQEFSLPEAATEVSSDLALQDAVLFVTAGDLTDSIFSVLKQRVMAGQRVVLAFNKQDQYLPADRQTVRQKLQQRVAGLPRPVEVAAIATAPRPIKVRRHQSDGQVEEWLEPVAPDVADLETALQKVACDRTELVLATTLRQADLLRQDVQTSLNGVRRERAMPLVEQLQWVAAATAFASPVPTLDLLAAVAINGQLVMDLGKVYGFSFSLDEAKAAAGTLASLTVKLGLVELSTQALTTVLKSHAATYVAGGMVQGLSAAYLTRMAGLGLIEYFEEAALAGKFPSSLSLEGIGQRLQTLFQQNSQGALLGRLVQQGLERLRPTPVASPTLQGSQA